MPICVLNWATSICRGSQFHLITWFPIQNKEYLYQYNIVTYELDAFNENI